MSVKYVSGEKAARTTPQDGSCSGVTKIPDIKISGNLIRWLLCNYFHADGRVC
jgi:hypothetical protein